MLVDNWFLVEYSAVKIQCFFKDHTFSFTFLSIKRFKRQKVIGFPQMKADY